MRLLAFAGLALLLALAPAQARERILDFHSFIEVLPDGDLKVTETIAVLAENDEIRRGIVRDFPTEYRDRLGNRVSVGFEVLSVRRDGRPEPWFTEGAANGVRLFIGERDVFVSPGRHVYEIVYRTTDQVAFHDDYDELYWNVTGTGWSFAIERASAEVMLPGAAASLALNGWTGPQGATGKAFTASGLGRNKASFATTEPLGVREGLTIAVAWPKGFVTPPTATETAGRFLADNLAAGIAWLGVLVIAGWYLAMWWRVGRDPAKGTIYPRFRPPRGLTPAGLRFVRRMGIDDKVLTAAILGLAVKGRLEIEETDKADYALRRLSDDMHGLSGGERAVLRRLFAIGERIELRKSNHKQLRGVESALTDFLQGEYEGAYFSHNRRYFVIGGILSGIVLVLAILAHLALAREEVAVAGIFLAIWLALWSFGTYKLGRLVLNTWRAARGGFANTAKAVFMSLFALPFLGGLVGGAIAFFATAGLALGVPVAVLIGLNALFYELLKAPTRAGRALLDEIEGFALYLGTAEGPRLEAMHPPDMTPEHFEAMLPFAVALDLEVPWSDRFGAALARAGAAPDPDAYRPRWYAGSPVRGFSPGSFAVGLGSSLTSSIAAASTPPGKSSSGGVSFGGGSSGGGGGGGGGSGW